jgi:hypothetical protein
MSRPRLIDELVRDRAERMLVASLSVHIEKTAEAFAEEALKDETFRHALRALIQQRSKEILDELLSPQSDRRRGAHECTALPPDDDPDFLEAAQQGPLVRAARAYLAELARPGAPTVHQTPDGEPLVQLSALRRAVKALLDDADRLIRALRPFVEQGDNRGIRKMTWRGPLGDAAIRELLRMGHRQLDGWGGSGKAPLEILRDYSDDEHALADDLLWEARELRNKLLEINGELWDPRLPR